MKRLRVGTIVWLALSLLSVSLAFAAGGFSLDWWSADGGGGTSTGGGHAIAGSAGQPDAGEMSGGRYALSGGVWQALPTATPTMTPTATATALPSATATVSPSPTPVPTLNTGGPSSKSVYLPLIMNGAP